MRVGRGARQNHHLRLAVVPAAAVRAAPFEAHEEEIDAEHPGGRDGQEPAVCGIGGPAGSDDDDDVVTVWFRVHAPNLPPAAGAGQRRALPVRHWYLAVKESAWH